MRCAGCGVDVHHITEKHIYVDDLGEATCDRLYDECEPCNDGDPHPHWVGVSVEWEDEEDE